MATNFTQQVPSCLLLQIYFNVKAEIRKLLSYLVLSFWKLCRFIYRRFKRMSLGRRSLSFPFSLFAAVVDKIRQKVSQR